MGGYTMLLGVTTLPILVITMGLSQKIEQMGFTLLILLGKILWIVGAICLLLSDMSANMPPQKPSVAAWIPSLIFLVIAIIYAFIFANTIFGVVLYLLSACASLTAGYCLPLVQHKAPSK